MSRKQRKLKELTDKWYDILKKDGFNDIEDSRQRLKNKDSRTMAFQNPEATRDFFLNLDSYIITADIPELHRQILQQFSGGIKYEAIALKVSRSVARVRQIVTKYKILLSGEIPDSHKEVLDLYVQGKSLPEISEITGKNKDSVRRIVQPYRQLVSAFPQE